MTSRPPLCRILAAVVVGAAMTVMAAAPASAADPESIVSYDTRIEIGADGSLRVTETISYDFGSNDRHGIYRRIPTRYRYDDTRDRVYLIDDVQARLDSTATSVEQDDDGGYDVLKIGYPDRTVTGRHTYRIEYTVRGALNRFDTHDELYWNAVGTEWSVPIALATATVVGPAPIQRVECFAGASGSQLGCGQKSIVDGVATFREEQLGPGKALTVVAALPRGVIAEVAPIVRPRHDLTAAFHATPTTVGGAVVLALLGGVVALVLAWRTGRDRRFVGLLPGLSPDRGEAAAEERKPLLGKPLLSVEFGAPEKIRPGQVGTLVDERANVVDIAATIVDLAVRRYLHIREIRPKGKAAVQDWELTKLRKGNPSFLRYEKTLFYALFGERDKVRLSELRTRFGAELRRIQGQLYEDIVRRGWYRESPEQTRRSARRLAVRILVGAIAVTVGLAIFTHVALLGVGLVVGSLAFLTTSRLHPARTGRGSAMLERIRGLRHYIETVEADQIPFQERARIFSEFLPYAMVFGLAEHWTNVFADLGGDPEELLYWYHGRDGMDLAGLVPGLRSFTVYTVGSVALASNSLPMSTPSTAGLSGFSGGYSGGGAGGGGGGSW